MTISVHLKPLESTRSREKACYYEATCIVDGVHYSAQSRYGATCELARILLDAGVTDAPMVVTHKGLKGTLTWPSLHLAAQFTYMESRSSGGVRRISHAKVEAHREYYRELHRTTSLTPEEVI